ncbi:MAG: PQQ-dependent sugar dehydrogenase [Solirubrobacterales bacterium]
MAHRGPRMVNLALALATAVACLFVLFTPGAGAVTLPPGFEQTTVISGLTRPQDVEIAPNGRVFVAEKTGIIKTYTSLDDTSATVVADLRGKVHNYGGRGLMSIVAHPSFPAQPYVYVYYTLDAPIGGSPPVYGSASGSFDNCSKATGGLDENCVVGSRISRLAISGETVTSEQVLVEDYCQQFPAHAGGGLAFGADGNLYATGSDGSTSAFWDYGQTGTPANPCGDPPGGVGANLTPPTSEGGRLRVQDLRTTGDPVGLAGTLIRINPSTGAGASGNPLAANPDPNAKRILAYGFRDPTHLVARPGTSDIWVADRGGGYFEEINRVSSASTVRNFGWPCYEGSNIRKRSDEQDLNVCEGLYAAGNADTDPHWAYDHELPVHAEENCEQDLAGSPAGSTLSGLEFYPAVGGTFPPMYSRALFFADRLRSCIWALLPGADGLPQKGNVIPFAGLAMRATDLEVTPEGDLLYVDQRNDVVQRIRYTVANQPPTAVATATPVNGVMPLEVTFSGLGSTDPDLGDVLTYAWDLDGDNLLDDSTDAEPTFTYETPGTYTVTLQVTDTRGATATTTVTVTVADSGLRTLVFAPVADARVEQGHSGTNYGSSSKLRTDGDPRIESVLRFNVAGIAGTVQSAKLRLRALSDSTSDGPALYSAAGGWTESGVKWSNRPTFGDPIGDRGAIPSNSDVEYDVQSVVTGNGELNLGLRQTSSNSVEFASKEDGTASRRPVLEVTYALPAPDPGPDPTPGPGPTPDPGAGTGTGPQSSPFVTVPSLTAPVTGGRAPSLALAAARKQRVLRRRGVVVVASCAAPCVLTASAKVSLSGASRALRLRGVVRKGRTGKQVRLRLRLSKKALRSVRRALRRGKRLTARVTVIATDAAGNSRKATRKIRLRR